MLRPVRIGFFTSLQGHNGVSPTRQRGDGFRGSLGSSPNQMQHHLHRVGGVFSAGLPEQAAVGLGLAMGISGALVTLGL